MPNKSISVLKEIEDEKDPVWAWFEDQPIEAIKAMALAGAGDIPAINSYYAYQPELGLTLGNHKMEMFFDIQWVNPTDPEDNTVYLVSVWDEDDWR